MKRVDKKSEFDKYKKFTRQKENDRSSVNLGQMIILTTLFAVSIVLLLMGFFNRNTEEVEMLTPLPNEKADISEEEDLSQYFDEAFSKSSVGDAQDETYLLEDPFRETCAETSGDGQPAISFGTVCYR